MSARKVVLDTGIIVSAHLWTPSAAARAFEHALETAEVLSSYPILREVESVLRRPDFERFIPRSRVLAIIAGLRTVTTPITPGQDYRLCDDPLDNHVLAVAVAGRARTLVTDDPDLLRHDGFMRIRCVQPADYLTRPVG